MTKFLAVLFAAALLLAACAPATSTPTPSVTRTPAAPPPTLTATPSATPTRTAASTLTPTLVVGLTPTDTPALSPSPTSSPSAASLNIRHVFVVVMENHGYGEIWDSSSAPYINSLGAQYARATNYHAQIHPSLPNYLQLFAGSNYGITTDCLPSSSCHVSAPNLGDSLDARGLSWKAYLEAMPASCYLASAGAYAPRHNPLVYFDDIRNDPLRCAAHDVPFSALPTDLLTAATTPNFSLIIPDVCHDMHDCGIAQGDDWLKANLPPILGSPACTADTCLVILTWDEDDHKQDNQVLTIFAGSAARTGAATSSAPYTHYSLLRTIEDIFGLPALTANDAPAAPMLDLLNQAPPD